MAVVVRANETKILVIEQQQQQQHATTTTFVCVEENRRPNYYSYDKRKTLKIPLIILLEVSTYVHTTGRVSDLFFCLREEEKELIKKPSQCHIYKNIETTHTQSHTHPKKLSNHLVSHRA